jgi:hypothetical protein
VVVALQDRESDVRKFFKKGSGVPVVLDSGGLAGKFGVQYVPTTVFIDSQGRIATVKVGLSTAGDLAAGVNGI